MSKLACNLVTGVLAVILCGVCLKIRQYVSKMDRLSQIQTFWLNECLDRTWVSLHAILLWASWQWSCVEYVSRSDSMSRRWTGCLKVRHSGSLVFLTKHERACMQSCYGRLGSGLVWSMSQDQTVCLEDGQAVSNSDILAHWVSWQNMSKLACNLVTGVLAVILCGVCLKIRQYVSKMDRLSQIQTFWLTECLDKTWVSLHAILLRASWQWSCVEYVSRSDSMSQRWTGCLKFRHSGSLSVLTKHE